LVHKPEWSLNEGGRNAADWLEKLGMSEYAQRFAEKKAENTRGHQRPRRHNASNN